MFLYKHFLGGGETSELDDVVRNLYFVLGSKRGTAYFLRTFGLSGPGFRTAEETITTLTAELRENIELYERRVELVDTGEEYDDRGCPVKLVARLRVLSTGQRLNVVADLRQHRVEVETAPANPSRR